MAPGAITFPLCAAVSFAWGCAVIPPVARAIRTALTRSATAAWTAVALAVLGAALWTMCVLAASVLAMIIAPNACLAVFDTPRMLLGAAGGLGLWVTVTIMRRRMPRLGPSFEISTAMAVVLVVTEETGLTDSIERMYCVNAVGPSPEAIS